MNILITGATGFLGNHLLKNLSKNEKYKIYASGRNENKMIKMVNVKWIKCDLNIEKDLNNLFSNIYDIIIHCAARSSTKGIYEDFYLDNYKSTKNITDILIRKKHIKTKFIYISTPSIYASNHNQLNINENSSIDKNYIKKSHYIWTKYLAEEHIKSIDCLNSIIIRPRAIIGPGDNAIWPNLMKANKKIGIPLFRKGEVLLSYTNIESVANFIKFVIENKKWASTNYNISDGYIKMKNIIEILKKHSSFQIKGKKLYFKPIQILLKIIGFFMPKGRSLSINEDSLALLYYDMIFDTNKAKKEGYKVIGSFEEIAKNNLKYWNNKEEKWKI